MNDRIDMEIRLPSISLKRFVERALADGDFFDNALENPLGSFRECGVNLAGDRFTPSDFARFFAALDRLREAIKAKRAIEEARSRGIQIQEEFVVPKVGVEPT